MATRQDYINKLHEGDITVVAKIQFLRREDESVYDEVMGDIIDGSLSITKANGTRRSLDITLSNITGRYRVDKYNIWVGTKIKLFLGVEVSNNDFYFEEQGIFIILNPSISSSTRSRTMTISAVDKYVLYNGAYSGNLFDYIQVTNGTNVNTAINNIVTSEAINGARNLDPKTAILNPITTNLSYTLRKGYGDTVSSVLEEIANFVSRNLYYNRFGFLVFEEDFDDTHKGSVWDFNSGEDEKTYISAVKNDLLGDVFNAIKVIGDDVNGNVSSATARNTNPLSDTNTDLIGEKFAPTIDDTRITTDSLAQKRADFELKKLVRLNSSINITSIPIFFLDVDEVISVTDSHLRLNNDRFVIKDINFSFGANSSTMSLNVTNVRELEFDLEV